MTKLRALTHWDRDRMVAISQTTFWNTFFSMKMFEWKFWLKFRWSLCLSQIGIDPALVQIMERLDADLIWTNDGTFIDAYMSHSLGLNLLQQRSVNAWTSPHKGLIMQNVLLSWHHHVTNRDGVYGRGLTPVIWVLSNKFFDCALYYHRQRRISDDVT